MVDKKRLKDYQGKKEYLVLSLVKKYPLYSVDKLNQELPNISRRSIQRILEKKDLSTAERRLAFADEKNLWSEKVKAVPKEIKGLAEKLKEKVGARRGFRLNWLLVRNLVILGPLAFVVWQGVALVSAKPPEIKLDQPEANFVNRGEKLFVSGRVNPASSRVTVGGREVSINGDGTFTAIINVPLGEGILEVEAVSKGKKARLVRLVSREATEEELQAEKEEEAKRRRAASDRVAELERTVNDLLAAKNATGGEKSFLRILNNHIKDEEDFYSITGEVMNLGTEEVSWVMITAKFYDQEGRVIDTKYGFATDFDQVIKPKEKAQFETQTTTKDFDRYSLDLSWEEGVVAGTATESATPVKGKATATPLNEEGLVRPRE